MVLPLCLFLLQFLLRLGKNMRRLLFCKPRCVVCSAFRDLLGGGGLQVIEGFTVVVSVLPPEQRSPALNQLVMPVVQPLVALLDATPEGQTPPSEHVLPYVDRLTVIVKCALPPLPMPIGHLSTHFRKRDPYTPAADDDDAQQHVCKELFTPSAGDANFDGHSVGKLGRGMSLKKGKNVLGKGAALSDQPNGCL